MSRIDRIADVLLETLVEHAATVAPDDVLVAVSTGVGRLVGGIAQSESCDLDRVMRRVIRTLTAAAREQLQEPAFPLA